MLPVAVADRMSPAPANAPAVIATVAPARLMLSTSLTVGVGESAVVAPWVNETRGSAAVTVGASLTAVMSIVEVALPVLLLVALSVIVHVTVRVGSEPNRVGLSLAVVNNTLSSADW